MEIIFLHKYKDLTIFWVVSSSAPNQGVFHWSYYHLFGYIALEFCRLDTRNSINVIKEKQYISKPYKSVKVLIPENVSGKFPVSWLEESILHLQHAASK